MFVTVFRILSCFLEITCLTYFNYHAYRFEVTLIAPNHTVPIVAVLIGYVV